MFKNGSYCLAKTQNGQFVSGFFFLVDGKMIIENVKQDLVTGVRKINTYEVTKVYPWTDRFPVKNK